MRLGWSRVPRSAAPSGEPTKRAISHTAATATARVQK
jgi:hypothetical protein